MIKAVRLWGDADEPVVATTTNGTEYITVVVSEHGGNAQVRCMEGTEYNRDKVIYETIFRPAYVFEKHVHYSAVITGLFENETIRINIVAIDDMYLLVEVW